MLRHRDELVELAAVRICQPRLMPIATCFIRDQLPPQSEIERLTGLWSEESGVTREHMTINVVAGVRQSGTPYGVLAFLYLPSLWSSEQVRRLQVGLAMALSRALAVTPASVHVITAIVESGHVVEHGETQEW